MTARAFSPDFMQHRVEEGIEMKLKIEVELDYGTVGERTALLAVEAAALSDQRILKSALDIENPVSVVRVPADD